MASQEVLDEIAAHPGVTQPGQQHPDPSPVEELLGYVRDTWTGPSKISFISANKIVNSLNKLKINNVFFPDPRFDPRLYSVFGRTMDDRTNNPSETWNSKWNVALNNHKHGVWRIICELKR
jgi:hypothetical protein